MDHFGEGQPSKHKEYQYFEVLSYLKIQCEQKSSWTWKSEGDLDNIDLIRAEKTWNLIEDYGWEKASKAQPHPSPSTTLGPAVLQSFSLYPPCCFLDGQ